MRSNHKSVVEVLMKYGLVKPQHKINKETPTLFAHGLLPPPRLKASGHHRSEPFLSCNRWSLSELIFWMDSSFLFMILFDGGGYATLEPRCLIFMTATKGGKSPGVPGGAVGLVQVIAGGLGRS
ncbi:hypothetical protein CEXT_79951 [Caerostris extrusa]|uniref:Uncharacterized protein n=1 Tax=Caerostris extrusa TaxID=172846 RepID=A0AAV4THV8_CAEEX|nr:hypothetical protein CEXT_79951 [Caerostris extrusa]